MHILINALIPLLVVAILLIQSTAKKLFLQFIIGTILALKIGVAAGPYIGLSLWLAEILIWVLFWQSKSKPTPLMIKKMNSVGLMRSGLGIMVFGIGCALVIIFKKIEALNQTGKTVEDLSESAGLILVFLLVLFLSERMGEKR